MIKRIDKGKIKVYTYWRVIISHMLRSDCVPKAIQHWTVVSSQCTTPGAEGRQVFGVQLQSDADIVWAWPDVDANWQVVEMLRTRLEKNTPEACHWAEIVEEFIGEVAGGRVENLFF